jgi:C-terminal peptidase prc
MLDCRGPLSAVLVLLSGSVAVAETPRAAVPAAAEARLRADAEGFERGGKWDKALDLYLKLYVCGSNTPDIRDHIRHCLRNVSQVQRQRDPVFRQFILTLSVSDALQLYAEAVGKMSALYADREKATVEKLFAAGLDELDRALSDTAFRQHLGDATDARIAKFRQVIQNGWKQKLPATPRDARIAAREVVASAAQQLGAKNGAAVVLELLCGGCNGLDEFSAYVTPSGAQAEFASPVLELAGYGLLVAFDDRGILIDGVVPGSWAAAHTPLRKGDRVLRLNERDVVPATAVEVTSALRAASPFGHELETAPTDFEPDPQLVKLPTPLPSVYAAAVMSAKEGVGYLRLAAFNDRTARELDDAVIGLKTRGVKALVLDLRGNPGGSFLASIHAAQRFVPSGIIVTTQGQSPDFAGRVFSSDSGMTAHDLPVVLLVDTRTMSAAEVFAAGLKDNGRATVVGMPTFGKGLVQAPIRLHSLNTVGDDGKPVDRSGVMILSVATVFGARGQGLNGTGVTPHWVEANADRQLALAVAKAIELVGGPAPGSGGMGMR